MTHWHLAWANLRRYPTRSLLCLAALTTGFMLYGLTLGIAEGVRVASVAQGIAVQPGMLFVAGGIAALGLLLIALLTSSAMYQAIRGRSTELAVLRAIGFSHRRIFALLTVETASICLPAATLGLLGARVLYASLTSWLPGLAVIPSPTYAAPILLVAGAVALAISMVIAALPARELARADLARQLRGSPRELVGDNRARPVEHFGGGVSAAQASGRRYSTAALLDLSLLRQTAIVTRIALSTLSQRLGGAILVIASSWIVVSLLLVPLTIAESIRIALTSSGDPARVVIRSSASALLHLSHVPDGLLRSIADVPGVAVSSDGTPLMQSEVFAWPQDLINRRTGKGGHTNVVGVSPQWQEMTPELRLQSGRLPRSGSREVIVGTLAAAKFSNLDRGTVQIGGVQWRVVGTFSTGGWWDGYIVANAADMEGLTLRLSGNAIRVRLSSPDEFAAFRDAVARYLPSSMTVERETEHYAAFWDRVPMHLVYITLVLAGLIGAGAALGTTLVIETALDARRRETATLRLLGFDARGVAASVVLEGMALTVSGALLGVLTVWLMMDGRLANGAWGVTRLVVNDRLLLIAIGWGAAIAVAGTSALALRTLNTTALEAIRQLFAACRDSLRIRRPLRLQLAWASRGP